MNDRVIYDGWLKLHKRKVNNREYEIIKNYDAVSAIILNEFGDILIVKQFRPAVMEETLEIPAGCIDIEGESSEDCLVREIEEETGLKIKKEELKKVISYKPIMGFSASTMHIFKAHINKEELKTNKVNDDDVSEVKWMPFEEFQHKIKNGVIYDDKTVMSYFYLCSLKDK
ncbi:ADP-ribose pyrophosphatase [Clostridium acetireducens DSM 10703]|uniref:ADP-ribose pyrophosphatase n=1 Tax=Clostridium acetireducens DSM 10703 TaxID=1121290 RepID=A0A1E8EXV3_9CLOT|nr:NUDIX hydrolase [Clostridium acetireducens]OFI05344.1 ADP-ribose pyrophosphatase [Clostridium acetireducens DSM 10703]